MKRKKKIIIWVAIIVVLIGGFLTLRIPSWTRTFGLSEDVIAGKTEPSAEETIRLSFYYPQHNNYEEEVQLYTKSEVKFSARWAYFMDWLFKDAKLVEVQAIQSEDPKHKQCFDVMYNEDTFWVSDQKDSNTVDVEYDLVRENADSPWRINYIGSGV